MSLLTQRINEKIMAMHGITYMRDGQHVKVLQHRIEDDVVTIVTDQGFVEFNLVDTKRELRRFLEVEGGDQETETAVAVFQNGMFGDLKNILMENIKNIKSDKDFIAQASAINESAKNLVEIGKLQIQAMRLMKR